MRTRTKLPRQGNMAGRNHRYTTGMVSAVGGTMIGRSPMHCGCLSGMLSSLFRRVEPYAPLLSPYGAFGRHYTDGVGKHRFTDVIMGTQTTRAERTTRTERMDSPERASQYSVGFHPTNTMRSTMAESHSQYIGLCPISTDKHYTDGNGMHYGGFGRHYTDGVGMRGWLGRRMTIGVWGMR